MLHVTNNPMKKIALLIMVLLILSTTGCGDTYKVTNEENSDNTAITQKDITISPPKALSEVTQASDSAITIKQITVIEGQNRKMELQLAPPSNDPYDITEQFIEAHQKNTVFIKKLLPDNPDNPDIQEATDKERDELDALNEDIKTPETIMVTSVTVSGPNNEVEKFEKNLEE